MMCGGGAAPDVHTEFRWIDGEIPSWVEERLISIYGNIYSTLAFCQSLEPQVRREICAVLREGEPIEIFVFKRTSRRIDVVNGFSRIDPDHIGTFACIAFKRFPSVEVISFPAMELPLGELNAALSAVPHLFQSAVTVENFVATLPGSAEEYRRQLGGGTRSNIKRRLEQIRRQHASFAYQVLKNTEITPAHVAEVLTYHRLRMQEKGMVSGIGEAREDLLNRLTGRFGLVGMARIDGEFAAGAIAYVVGTKCYFQVTGHDAKFNHLNIGIISLYLLICECIGLGVKEFHFLWGESEYKTRLLGEKREMVSFTVYRSRLAAARHGRTYLGNAIAIPLRTVKQRARRIPALKAVLSTLRRARTTVSEAVRPSRPMA